MTEAEARRAHDFGDFCELLIRKSGDAASRRSAGLTPGALRSPPTAAAAIAAATGTAETNEDLAQCEASQSGPKGNAQQSEPREQEG